jgi:hypothetical protein
MAANRNTTNIPVYMIKKDGTNQIIGKIIQQKTVSNMRYNTEHVVTPTEKKNETEKCKTILSGDVNAPSVRACFHLTAFYSG